MKVIDVRNVNEAWDTARVVMNSRSRGVPIAYCRPSRNGSVIEWPEPVTTVYRRPTERVLFNTDRNCNPFLHFFESLYFLAGKNEVAYLAQFAPRMKQFSDDGTTLRGSYGYRWRQWFVLEREEALLEPEGLAFPSYGDQLHHIINMMKKSPDERRAVLAMWDASEDLDRPDSKDVPCNLTACFKIRAGRLTMTVMNRSNDIVWGCYGSNVVHFSYLLEYMAARIGVPVGEYYQVSDSWHAYTDQWEQYGGDKLDIGFDPYLDSAVTPYAHFMNDPDTWDAELLACVGETAPIPYRNVFFPDVALPLYLAWQCYKMDDFTSAYAAIHQCMATDWSLAAGQWLRRIEAKRAAKRSYA